MVAGSGTSKLERGVVIAGRYGLVSRLGGGGMGAVWRARHLQLDVDVAIKFMSPRLASSQELRERFEREAKSAARMKTRHVARVLDHGVDGDAPFIVLELLEGEDLRRRMSRRGRFRLREVADLVDQIARGLQCAHDADIVHRDIKPSNIFVTREDGETVIKLLDFGVAKTPVFGGNEHLTETGVMLGSTKYMSPEQARSTREVDLRTDLWSLAVIAYQCITGHHPFEPEDASDVLLRIVQAPVPKPSSYVPDLPLALDSFFARALARLPVERFGSALEMAREFRASCGIEAVTLSESTGEDTATVVVPAKGAFGSRLSGEYAERDRARRLRTEATGTDVGDSDDPRANDADRRGGASALLESAPIPMAVQPRPVLLQDPGTFSPSLSPTRMREARTTRVFAAALVGVAVLSFAIATIVLFDARPRDDAGESARVVGSDGPMVDPIPVLSPSDPVAASASVAESNASRPPSRIERTSSEGPPRTSTEASTRDAVDAAEPKASASSIATVRASADAPKANPYETPRKGKPTSGDLGSPATKTHDGAGPNWGF